MSKLSSKVAYPIIIAGIFVIVSIVAISYDNLNASFYLIFILLIIFIFLYSIAVGQNLTSPVKKLLERADDLSKGELESRFFTESQDEIGELSTTFNKIAHKLEDSNYENEKTKKMVGLRIEVETRALRDTISNLEQKLQNKTSELQKKEVEVAELKEKLNAAGKK